MIVSASYRTDIPALYGRWFINRWRAGFARVINPYGGPPTTISLCQGVDGFVFWTRNVAPFTEALALVRAAGLPFMVSHTVTGYPRALERSVVEPERAVAAIRAVAASHGPRAVVWRYDPIVFSTLTPADFHRANFTRLAKSMAGVVDEVVISFAQIYRKSARNLDTAALSHGFQWRVGDDGEKRTLASDLAAIAAGFGMRVSVCSQPDYTASGTEPAVCVDARRLEAVAAGWGLDRAITVRSKGNRPGCACHESRDIGAYDTCLQGCTYCYAVGSAEAARRRYRRHDPDGEFLFVP